MARHDTMIVATAGEHFVAFRLAQLGYVVALTRAGSPSVDLLVSDRKGVKTCAVQVKTAEWALRNRGRGSSKIPHHLEFPLGHKAAGINDARFVYVFVNLKGRDAESTPDAYIVPSDVIYKYCEELGLDRPLIRWHVPIAKARPFLNDWSRITNLL